MEMWLDAEGVKLRDVRLERLGVDHAQAPIACGTALVVEVRLEEAAGLVLEDAVLHQLDSCGRIATDRRAFATCDEPFDLLRAARPIPPERTHDAGRQLATTGQRRVGDLFPFGRDARVLPAGDAQRVELGLGKAQA